MAIINECLSIAEGLGISIDYLSNGFFCISKDSCEVFYDQISDLYSDLLSGRVNDYLLRVI
jgi:hypothetical protein